MTSSPLPRSGAPRPTVAAAVLIALLTTFLTAATAGPSTAAAPAAPTVPAPVITTPPVGTHGHPFMADPENLTALGYAEQEFFVQGTATSYEKVGTWSADGHWTVKPADKASYKTRILVRRPVRQSRFNGTVVVEWLNNSEQNDAAPDWVYAHDELLRHGFAWVGVSAQAVGVTGSSGLTTWDPARYGTLVHPGDKYSYSIFSQVAQAIRRPMGPNPLDGLTFSRVIADGESQSALRLVTYLNTQAATAKVFDAYLVHSNASFAAPLADGPLDLTLPTAKIRTDLTAPVFVVETESDVALSAAARQPDTKTVHTWEVAGSAHADRYLIAHGGFGDLSGFTVDPNTVCGQGNAPVNDGPGHYAANAALAALDTWTRGGPAPATGTPITMGKDGIVRDPATGLARGGVRLPDIAVPTRTIAGGHGGDLATIPCILFGSSDPWNGDTDSWDKHDSGDPSDPAGAGVREPVLRTLYPTHADYVSKVTTAARSATAAGFLTPADAEMIVAAAQGSTIGG